MNKNSDKKIIFSGACFFHEMARLRLSICLLFMMLMTSVSSLADQKDVKLFGDIIRDAMLQSPDFAIADARIEQARQSARQRGSYRFPRIDVAAGIGPEHNDPAPTSDTGHAHTTGKNIKLALAKLVFDGGASRSEYQRSLALTEAASAEARIVAEELFRDVVRYYIDYWRFQLESEQAEDFIDTMQGLVSKLNTMYTAGAASKIEVDFARARLASAQGVASTAKSSLNNTFSELEYLMQGLRRFRAMSPEEFTTLDLLPLSEYMDRGEWSNSGFVTNAYNAEATRLRVNAQRGRLFPTIDFELSGSLVEDEGGPSEVRGKAGAKLLLSYTLYNGGERRGAIDRARAQLKELEAERLQLERDVFRSIDQSYNSITASQLGLQAVEAEIKANRELQRLNWKNLQMGRVNIIELIDVEERLFNARARSNEVVSTIYQSYYDLLLSSGYIEQLLEKFSLQLPEGFGNFADEPR
ncbi:MAG: TolC family protein [Granulosicoccus sp.]